MGDTDVSDVIIAGFGFLGIAISAIAAWHARAANRAVNRRPKGEPKIYDLVRATRLEVDALAVAQGEMAGKVEQLGEKANRTERELVSLAESHRDHLAANQIQHDRDELARQGRVDRRVRRWWR